MLATLQPGFDPIARSALLGLQFRDAVDGRCVSEGLQVEIQDLWQPRRRLALTANRSGVFALHAFAGLRGWVDDAAQAVSSPADPSRFRVTAIDTLGRYLPVSLRPELPISGLWSPDRAWSSPPDRPPHVPLFSATTREMPGAMASLRAELRRASQPAQAAAWARLELWLGARRIAHGQADGAGRALLLFALPRPREATLGTSPAGPAEAFEWTVTLRAFWNPANRADTVPDFDDVEVQPETALLQSALPPLGLPALLLRAGETLQAAQAPSSFVYVAD
jgi:hypothetical protein